MDDVQRQVDDNRIKDGSGQVTQARTANGLQRACTLARGQSP